MFGLLIALTVGAFAACPSPREVGELDAQVERAVDRYALNDRPGFEAAAREAEATLRCVEGVVDPDLVARLHLVAGLRQRSPEDAAPFMQAAACAGLTARSLPAALERGTVGENLSRIPVGKDACAGGRVLEPALGGRLRVDGKWQRRTGDMPYVFQRVVGQERARDSQYVGPRDRAKYVPLRPTMIAIMAASAITSGAMLGGAWMAREELYSREFAPGELGEVENLKDTNQTLVIASSAVGVVGTVALVGFAVSFR